PLLGVRLCRGFTRHRVVRPGFLVLLGLVVGLGFVVRLGLVVLLGLVPRLLCLRRAVRVVAGSGGQGRVVAGVLLVALAGGVVAVVGGRVHVLHRVLAGGVGGGEGGGAPGDGRGGVRGESGPGG